MTSNYYLIEGIDGSGKTTVIKDVQSRLMAITGREVLTTREPGGHGIHDDPVLSGIRSILKSGFEIDPLCELMLFMADRAQHREMVVKPALARKAIILQDRGFLSSLAYQHYGRGMPIGLIGQLNDLTMSDIKPKLILWIDTPLDEAMARIKNRVDSYEAADFQRKVYNGYKALYQSHKYPIHRIDGHRQILGIADDIVKAILEYV